MGDEEVVLVTGATGFIASHIIQQLLEQGYKVRGTVRNLNDEDKIKPLRALGGDSNVNLELVEAELLDADCWSKAVEGCKFVLHTAGPFPFGNPDKEDEVIKPAVDGTLNVLRACAGKVSRVVATSSIVAIDSGHGAPPNGDKYTEADWGIPEKATSVYEKSKILAEKAAWEYVKDLPEEQKFDLVVLNPCLSLGPMLLKGLSTSIGLVFQALNREMSLLPKLNFSMIDVRDVAKAHIIAMKFPDAAGKRYILAADNMWFGDLASVLEKEFKPMGYNIPTSYAPYALLWLFGRFDKGLRSILPLIDRAVKHDNTRMINELGITPRPIDAAILDTGYSLIERGYVNKTPQYKPRE